MLALALAAAVLAQEPDAQTLYHQAVGCAASADVARDGSQTARDLDQEILTWGLVMAGFGPQAGRSPAQVDHEDIDRARAFFVQMREARPQAFAAHRAFCQSLLP